MNGCMARSVVTRARDVEVVGLRAVGERAGRGSRSSWSAAASSVACLVISVSSFMCSSCSMSSMESLIRRAPSVVAATTGSASSETRRVLMRQLRRAIREPGPSGPCGSERGRGSASPLGRRRAGARSARHRCRRTAAGPWFWACWGEEPRSVPPRGSGSAAALPSLLKRPCTSVATSGPGVPPRERRDGVGVVGARTRPMVVVSDRRCSPFPPPLGAALRPCAPVLIPRRSVEFQHSAGSPTRARVPGCDLRDSL